MTDENDPVAAFIRAASVPLDAAHVSGTLDEATALLAAHPDLPARSIYAAAALGDEAAVKRFLAQRPEYASAKGGPHGWDALTYVCFSRYLRLDPARSDGLVRTATALLEAGASASTGWFDRSHRPEPEWESALYGAAGVAHHARMTRLLLERGADPNDEEVPYHAPETWNSDALRAILESGRLTADSLATMLLRKADWHDRDGMVLLLEHGADPNRMTRWGYTALHQALRRDNDIAHIEALLEGGADPALGGADGRSAVAIAAERGRRDVLDLFRRRGMALGLTGADRLIAACAASDAAAIQALVQSDARAVDAVRAEGARLLAEFAGNGNTAGVGALLDLGVAIEARYGGDSYFDIAGNSTALHVAAWRARHDTVKALIGRGASVDPSDGRGRTPLALAVRACVDSYWMGRRSPESVEALLRAGATVRGIPYPSGYVEVDALLASHGA
jgi:ankyrin repeat protein